MGGGPVARYNHMMATAGNRSFPWNGNPACGRVISPDIRPPSQHPLSQRTCWRTAGCSVKAVYSGDFLIPDPVSLRNRGGVYSAFMQAGDE